MFNIYIMTLTCIHHTKYYYRFSLHFFTSFDHLNLYSCWAIFLPLTITQNFKHKTWNYSKLFVLSPNEVQWRKTFYLWDRTEWNPYRPNAQHKLISMTGYKTLFQYIFCMKRNCSVVRIYDRELYIYNNVYGWCLVLFAFAHFLRIEYFIFWCVYA